MTADSEPAARGVTFDPASGIDPDSAAQAQAILRRRMLRAFVGRGLLESFGAKEMLSYLHSGFSGGVDADVCIESQDRAGLEWLLRANGFPEAINGWCQASKRRACGFTRLATIRTVIFLIAGKIDFHAVNPHAGQPT